MKDLLKLFVREKNKQTIKALRKPKAQSFVEFALMLPILIMLLTGMVEFGFLLNTYLNLLDATRQAARFYSNTNPYRISATDLDTNGELDDIEDDPTFYTTVAQSVVDYLAPPDADTNKLILDETEDDVIVSVAVVSVSESTDTIVSIIQHPNDDGYYSFYGNQGAEFGDPEIEALMTKDGSIPVRTALLIVELYYGYDGVLKLPWLDIFFNEPVMLHSYTFMPLVAAKPDPVP